MSSQSRLQLPVRKPTYKLALIPLADAMFQLLIFFMLSSSQTPYSLLTLQTAPGTDPAAAVPGAETTADPGNGGDPADVALWTVEREGLVISGQRFGFDSLPDLAAALGTASAAADVVLILRPEAEVQDVASILEALQAANVGSVRISTGGA